VNRRQRRDHDRRRRRLDRQIHTLLDASARDGKPWAIHGLTDACADCDAVAAIRGTPGTGMIWADIRVRHEASEVEWR
jgi:hypothetical protein